MLGFFFIIANICFADVVNNDRLDISKIFFTEIEKVDDSIFAVGENGIILSSLDGGKKWIQHKIAYKGLFTSFNFNNSETGLFLSAMILRFFVLRMREIVPKNFNRDRESISFMKVKWLSTHDALIVGDFGSVFVHLTAEGHGKKILLLTKILIDIYTTY